MCCWRRQAGNVCDASAANIHAARGVAIREFPLPGYGFADYLLYVIGTQPFRFFCEFAQKITYRTTGTQGQLNPFN